MGLLDTWREVRQQIIDSKPQYEPFITPTIYESPFVSTLGVDDATPTNVASAAPLRRKPLPAVWEGPEHLPVYKPAPPALTDQIREGFSFGLGPVSEEDRLKARAAEVPPFTGNYFSAPIKSDYQDPSIPLRYLNRQNVPNWDPSKPHLAERLINENYYTSPFGGEDFGQRDERPADVWAIEAGLKDPSLPLNRFIQAFRDKPETKKEVGYFPSETPDYILDNLFGSGLPGRPDRQGPAWVDRLYTRKRSETPPGADRVIGAFYTDDQVPIDPDNPDTAQVIDMMVANTGMTRSQALDALVAQDSPGGADVAQDAVKLQAQINQPDPALINMHPDYVAGADRRRVPSLIDAAADQIAADEAEEGGLMGLLSGPLNLIKQRQRDAQDIYGISPVAGFMAGAGIPLASMLIPNPLSLPFSLLAMLGGEQETPYDFYGKPVTDIKHGRGGMNWYGADIPGAGIYTRTQGRLGPAGAPITIHSPSGLLESTISEDERSYNITPKMSAIAQTPEIVGMRDTGADYFGTGEDFGTGTTVMGEVYDWADFY